MTQPTIYLLVVLILAALLAMWYLTKRSKKSNGIILPKDLKETSLQYVERKEDDHRKFNNRKGY